MGAQGVENKRAYELNEEEINKLREEVGKYTTESDLVSTAQHWAQHHPRASMGCTLPCTDCERAFILLAAPPGGTIHQAAEGHPVLPRPPPHHGEGMSRHLHMQTWLWYVLVRLWLYHV